MGSDPSEYPETASARLNVHKFPFREVSPITPNIEVPWSFADAVEGRDNQLAAAAQALNGAPASGRAL